MRAFSIVCLLLAVCVFASALKLKNKAKVHIKSNGNGKGGVNRMDGGYTADSVTELKTETNPMELAAYINAGYVSKSSSVMIAWIAASDTSSTIKEIHVLAGGETGVTSGRTFVYDISSWAGFTKWSKTYASQISKYGTVNAAAGTVDWEVRITGSDPEVSECSAFSLAVSNSDLTAALMVASDYAYRQGLDISENGMNAMLELQTNSVLLAERLDTACLGYKFFSYQDSPSAPSDTTTTTTTTTTDGAATPVWSD